MTSPLAAVAPVAQRLLQGLVSLRMLALLLLIGFVALRISDPYALKLARLQVFDVMQQMAPRTLSNEHVAIVDIDEKSLAELGQWPWPRDVIGQMVEKLVDGGAKVVGFDMVFAEADRLSPAAFAASADNLPMIVRGVLEELPSTDALFAETVARTPVALGMSASGPPPGGDGYTPLRPRAGFEADGADPRRFLFAFPGLLRNIAPLEQAASAIGMFSLTPEPDGVVRRVPLALRAEGAVYPSLSMEMMRLAAGERRYRVTAGPEGIERVSVGPYAIDTDPNGRAWVRYAHHQPSLYVSAADVIAGRMPAGVVDGKFVLVGTSAVGLRDLRVTPMGEIVPGVEVHAQLIDGAVTGHKLVRPLIATSMEHGAAVVIGLLLIAITPALSAARGLLVAGGLVGLIWLGAYAAFADQSVLLDPTYPSVAALAVFAFLAYGGYARSEKQKRQIRSAFRQYLSPDLVEQLADDPESLELGGASREMTFLFCDIAGFTSFVEQAEPEALVRLLNEYLDGVCQIVMDHGGTIDKIVGDAVHAMFNAPLDDQDHGANAVRAALAIEAFVLDFRARKQAEGYDFGSTRIGVNTGPAVVGNFGGASRFDYTAHGDAINTAARLEGVNKHLGTAICVSGSTRALCPEIPFRPIGTLFLKGKEVGVEAYAPIRAAEIGAPVVDAYAAAFDALRDQSPAAPAAFDELAEAYPTDPLIALHQRRLVDGARGAEIRLSEK